MLHFTPSLFLDTNTPIKASLDMDYTRVATVSSLTSSGDHSDTDATFDKAVEKLPISFHEGRKFEDFLRRLELNALLKTGTHSHKLNQLHGLLNTSQALPLMASALLPEEMRPAKEAAVPLSASLPTATDRAAFTTCLCGGDAALAREVLNDEASWDLPSRCTPSPHPLLASNPRCRLPIAARLLRRLCRLSPRDLVCAGLMPVALRNRRRRPLQTGALRWFRRPKRPRLLARSPSLYGSLVTLRTSRAVFGACACSSARLSPGLGPPHLQLLRLRLFCILFLATTSFASRNW